MKNSLAVEIAREARRKYPLNYKKRMNPNTDEWKFRDLAKGQTVYLARYGEGPVATTVTEVNDTHGYIKGGPAFRRDDGVVDPCGHAQPCVVSPETPELREWADLKRLRTEMARAFGVFNARKPSRDEMLAVLRLLDPEAWK